MSFLEVAFWVVAALVCAFLAWALLILPIWRTGRALVQGFREKR